MTRTGVARRFLVAALLGGLIACSRQDDGNRRSASNDAATTNDVSAANTVAAAPEKPAGLPPAQALAAAFAVAFPQGAIVGRDDNQLTYEAQRLVPLPGGDRVALLAEGSNEDTCHACTGKLRVTYLARSGAGFAPLSPPVETVIEGNGFGGPPAWMLAEGGPVPLLNVVASYTAQGCTESDTELYRLEAAGVVQDKAATRKTSEGC